jgi:high-affinity iron transporter
MRRILCFVVAGSLLLFFLGTAHAKDPIPPKKTPELLNQGKKVYEQNCSVCHGSKGDGKGPAGVALQPPPTNFTKPLRGWPNTKGDPNKVFEVITKGIPNSAMVKWDQFSEQERWALVYTAVGFAAPKAPPKKAK